MFASYSFIILCFNPTWAIITSSACFFSLVFVVCTRESEAQPLWFAAKNALYKRSDVELQRIPCDPLFGECTMFLKDLFVYGEFSVARFVLMLAGADINTRLWRDSCAFENVTEFLFNEMKHRSSLAPYRAGPSKRRNWNSLVSFATIPVKSRRWWLAGWLVISLLKNMWIGTVHHNGKSGLTQSNSHHTYATSRNNMSTK